MEPTSFGGNEMKGSNAGALVLCSQSHRCLTVYDLVQYVQRLNRADRLDASLLQKQNVCPPKGRCNIDMHLVLGFTVLKIDLFSA